MLWERRHGVLAQAPTERQLTAAPKRCLTP
jgi:hypothetical protein